MSGYGRDSSPAVKVRDSRQRLTRWNSGTDGIVRMVEDLGRSETDFPRGSPLILRKGELQMNRKDLPLLGILTAMSLVLEVFVHFPVLAAAPYLLYSPGDLPIILASVIIGPAAGVAAAFANATLFVLLTGEGGPWGALMHFIASGGMVLVIGWISKKTGRTHLAMLAGILTRIALMVPLNLLITPIYTGLPRSAIMGMIIPIIVPFNLIHAGINTVLSFALLKALPARLVAKER